MITILLEVGEGSAIGPGDTILYLILLLRLLRLDGLPSYIQFLIFPTLLNKIKKIFWIASISQLSLSLRRLRTYF